MLCVAPSAASQLGPGAAMAAPAASSCLLELAATLQANYYRQWSQTAEQEDYIAVDSPASPCSSTSSPQAPQAPQRGCCGWPAQRRVGDAFCLFSDVEQEFLCECLHKETKAQASATYLATTQREVDAHKRLVLVDWMVEVVDEFRLSQESLFLSISLLDRFLSVMPVPRPQLQLLGATCLWVAAKYEEVMPPCLADFVDITDHSYAPDDLVRLEAVLLTTLRYELAVPTPLHFLHQLLSHAQLETGTSSPRGPCHPECPAQARLAHLSEYLLELALLTPDTLAYRPSVVAASALQLAANLLAAGCDPASRAAYGTLCAAISAAAGTALDGCMAELARMHAWAGSTPQPPSVKDKYSDGAHSCVALLRLGGGW